MRQYLYQSGLDHDSTALSQLQQVLCISGKAHADSVKEMICEAG